MITYLDRACIGKMAPEIMRDLELSTVQMSWVFSAFAFAYALFEIPTAWWADRIGTRIVLTRIVVWWSCFTMATAGAFNYASLLATRFLFGMGEAGAWPCVARTFSRWIPARERGTIKGVFFAGAYLSGGLTPPLVVLLLGFMHWRWIFVAFGLTGIVWAVAWYRWFRDEPAGHPAVNQAESNLILAERPAEVECEAGWGFWRHMLRQRNVVGLCLMYVPNCVTFYFCITWLPTYLKERHGFDAAALGLVSGLPLLLSVGSQFLGGFFSDWITARFGLRAGRRAPGILGYALAAVAILSAAMATAPVTAAVLIALATASCMFTTASAWGTCVDIGREHSGVVSAVMNTAGQLGSILSPLAVGYSVKWFGNWNLPLYLLGALFLIGAACWLVIDPRSPVFGETRSQRAVRTT
jgi:MFS family permease